MSAPRQSPERRLERIEERIRVPEPPACLTCLDGRRILVQPETPCPECGQPMARAAGIRIYRMGEEPEQ